MKPTVKLASLFLAVLMLFSVFASGCTLNKEWSYKTKDKTLAIGVYLTAMYECYLEAQNYASKLDDYDASSSKWLDLEITDDEGNTAVAKDWIKENTERKCLELLAIEAELKKMDATVDEATVDRYAESMENYWYQGLKKTLEPKGVSLESFKYYTSRYTVEYEKLFDLFYGEEGTKRPGKDEITKYFEQNYIEYAYLPVALTATSDEAATGKVALSEAEANKVTTAVDAVKETVNKSADAAAADEAFAAAIAEYMSANGLTEDSLTTATSVQKKVNTGTDELDEALKTLEEGKAVTLKVGEADSAQYYCVYRYSTAKAKTDYLTEDGANDSEVIKEMKTKEYREYLAGVIKDIGYEKSKYVGKYQPSMFFEKPKNTGTSVITG